ncbi:hypothetical protein CIHG_08868 [Coccidioides immitis H538.4]|uniref:Retrovirus-related Pol polyprotein from transposon TNT 1-94-like beta-barrel domain-containing protein n=1 Tax=Coccidioides immitis H538.4 TaxID=396776 RepID=A0A0J8S1F4_COCIT|nr:hypothetical protein CIHG_08868 [Coccidioides immitis H538.4]
MEFKNSFTRMAFRSGLVASIFKKAVDPETWLIDTCCSYSICCNKAYFTSFNSTTEYWYRALNREIISIKSSGIVHVRYIIQDGIVNKIHIHAWYNLKLGTNLLFTNQLTEKLNLYFTEVDYTLQIQRNYKLVRYAKKSDSVTILKTEPLHQQEKAIQLTYTTIKLMLELLYRQLGHCAFSTTQKAAKDQEIKIEGQDTFYCKAYALERSKQQIF